MSSVNSRDLRIVLFGVAGVAAAGCQPSRDSQIAQNQATINHYCLDCHNYAEQVGGLTLERANLANVAADPEKWEHVVRKLRAGMMPPPGNPRPHRDTYVGLASWLEGELDRHAVEMLPPPGLHRLNRAEYGNAVRDLLALDIDSSAFLPADDVSRGFDNQAGTLGLSPALLEAYLSAAGKISRAALGRVSAPTQAMYRLATDTTQNYHVEGLPFGTRGGLVVEHEFPEDATYNLKIYSVNLGNMGNFRPFGEIRGEKLEVLIDGERVGLIDWDEAFGLNRGGFGGFSGQLKTIDVKVPVTAGPHRVGVTFLATNYAPGLDMNRAFDRSTIETGGLPGFTFYPHVGSVRIDGPYDPTGAGDTPSRRRVLTCTPATPAEEQPCAERIVKSLARIGYRGLQTDRDVATLLQFYAQGRADADFESGIEAAIERLLTDPKFIYRVEREPAEAAVGAKYKISDLELASRLSFFLWSSIPDDQLLTVATQGKLTDPAVLEREVKRMLADPRSEALTANFAGQWLNLRALEGHVPVASLFPDFDDNLRHSFRRETELFFDSLVREDRPITDLLTADYTFVDERLAKHYGIPGIYGSRFQRVTLGPELDARRGLLGKGSLLATSSQPVRTSPVIRGYWVLQNLLGEPPPPPPPNVPMLKPVSTDATGNTKMPSMRQQMEQHRRDPVCAACHTLMDPIGFALEQFDAVGTWRTKDGSNNSIDANAVMYDGTKINGPADLRNFVLGYSDQFARTVTEKLMTYALGRGVEYYDMPVVRGIVRDAEKDHYRFQTLILDVVKSEPFQMNSKPGTTPVTRQPSSATTTTAANVN
ncbi:MAG TPA: DUF1592 domain-containing protein [Gammaproteobacteria bacterium]|nr:DUF1592 domain-containing protein [Gammaproteobacteria bacterium]